jgi:hypothetical protein
MPIFSSRQPTARKKSYFKKNYLTANICQNYLTSYIILKLLLSNFICRIAIQNSSIIQKVLFSQTNFFHENGNFFRAEVGKKVKNTNKKFIFIPNHHFWMSEGSLFR